MNASTDKGQSCKMCGEVAEDLVTAADLRPRKLVGAERREAPYWTNATVLEGKLSRARRYLRAYVSWRLDPERRSATCRPQAFSSDRASLDSTRVYFGDSWCS